MTNERKIEVLSKHFGWIHNPNGYPYGAPVTWLCGQIYSTNPLSDLNVAALCEHSLTPAKQINYVAALWNLHPVSKKSAFDYTAAAHSQIIWWHLTTATAPQRFEAILKSLGLWEE